ncbi:MAG: hypothetical protein ACOCUD_03355 [Bacillota bacterium]
MNKFKNALKRINLKDLLFVFLYGIILSILFGIMIGLIDSLITKQIRFSLSFIFFFISSRWLGRQIRRQYEMENIYYTIIAFIGLFIQAVIVLTISAFARQVDIVNHPEIFLNERIYIQSFVSLMETTFTTGFFGIMNNLITFLLYGVGIYIGVRETY